MSNLHLQMSYVEEPMKSVAKLAERFPMSGCLTCSLSWLCSNNLIS